MFCFALFCFEKGSHHLTLSDLELIRNRLFSNPQILVYLCLWSGEIQGLCHHAWRKYDFFKILIAAELLKILSSLLLELLPHKGHGKSREKTFFEDSKKSSVGNSLNPMHTSVFKSVSEIASSTSSALIVKKSSTSKIKDTKFQVKKKNEGISNNGVSQCIYLSIPNSIPQGHPPKRPKSKWSGSPIPIIARNNVIIDVSILIAWPNSLWIFELQTMSDRDFSH